MVQNAKTKTKCKTLWLSFEKENKLLEFFHTSFRLNRFLERLDVKKRHLYYLLSPVFGENNELMNKISKINKYLLEEDKFYGANLGRTKDEREKKKKQRT